MNVPFEIFEQILTTAVTITSTYYALKGKIEKIELLVSLQKEQIKELQTQITKTTNEVEEMRAVAEYKKQIKNTLNP